MKAVVFETSKQGKRVRVVNTAGLDITSDNAPDLLTAIGESRQPDCLYAVWDTAAFWKPIFSLLPAAEVANLTDGKAGHLPGGFRLWWGITRHGRVIGIRYVIREQIKGNFYSEKRGEIEISELKQYYDSGETPADLKQTAEMGQKVIITLEGMGLKPSSLISAIAIYKENVLDKLPIPTIYTMPETAYDAHELAYNAVDEWAVNYQSWAEGRPAFSYDLTSA